MNENDEKYIYISEQTDLDYLIERIDKRELFAKEFKFTDRSYLIALLEELRIDYEEFTKAYYYYDQRRQIHISESQFGYVWISTYGLIAKSKATSNKLVNASVTQYTTLSLLLNKAIEISESEKVYDVDGHNFGLLNELSPALFHNLLFYVEVFCKAYLSLSGVGFPNTHKLAIVYSRLIDAMFLNNHNDSIFHIQIVNQFEKIVKHVTSISGNFKEQFVKYDDNPDDVTIIIFQREYLYEMKTMVELCHDFILEYYYTGNDAFYLRSGIYQRVLSMAKTEEQKERIRNMYHSLLHKNKQDG